LDDLDDAASKVASSVFPAAGGVAGGAIENTKVALQQAVTEAVGTASATDSDLAKILRVLDGIDKATGGLNKTLGAVVDVGQIVTAVNNSDGNVWEDGFVATGTALIITWPTS